jgi:filamentous hemagglutinin family protein
MKSKLSFLNRAHKSRGIRKSFWLAALLIIGRNGDLFANPTGMRVVSGSGQAQQLGALLNVTVSQAAILNWKNFNIKPGETTTFLQPSGNSVVFNEIGGANPSQIFGNLNANGTVILANANGFYFGPNSMISVGGSFIATTAPITPDFGAGSAWQFTGMPPLASIVNYGQIKVGEGKSLYLIAEQLENHGDLVAPGGDVGLYAGESVLVSERPDGRGLSANMKVPRGSVNNFGQITADAGTIALQAEVVNQNGIIQADSVQNKNGVIELVASDSLNLGANSQILAHGDDSTPGSAGGNVTLQSGNNFSDSVGSQIVTSGGAQGGNGGNIEVSAPNVSSLNSSMEASAQSGWNGGEFFLDPVNIILGTSTAGGAINVNTAFAGFSTILLQATGNISINASTTWNLSTSTGQTGGQLTLEAGGDITFGNSSKIMDAGSWSVTLDAGYNFVNNTVQAGIGNIYLNGGNGLTGNGSIQTGSGNINLTAGQSILLASQSSHQTRKVSGSVYTTGGGSIFAYAMSGNIDAGTSNGANSTGTQQGDYSFSNSGYKPNTVLGGISTKAGGDVTLIAGNNIDSTPTPPTTGSWLPGASGAYGAGDVTVIAGNQINGNYTLANGTGTMLAGVQTTSAQAAALQNPGANTAVYASTLQALETAVTQAQDPNGNIGGIEYPGGSNLGVTLSLIQGSWNVWAANNILLKEVNNPNGTFNSSTSSENYLYDYAPDAAANFWAGNAIELGGGVVGGTLARNGNPDIIYAPSLSLNAGAGGITIDNSIILAPSSEGEGSLEMVTRNGGDLKSGSTANSSITMSDSGSTDYTTFNTGHAASPLYLNDPNPNPVLLDISGDIESFNLNVPTFASITVQGNTFDFGFIGRNLSANQTTTIAVIGAITYQDFSAANPTATLGNEGLTLAGPGNFNVNAGSIDLGVSGGINVVPSDPELAAITPYGANLHVTTVGDLTLTSSTIANDGLLGGIKLDVGGELDAGGEFTLFGDPDAPKGIFTTGGGDVAVTASGDINVNGSRIAAYDGGNVDIESENGDVNAGVGGAGFVTLNALELDSKTHQLTGIPATIPGSGILATTVAGSDATLGNITINTPKGSINASSGGILQIAFNGTDTKNSLVNLDAGLDIIATGSGVIGANVTLQAGRTITGLFVAQHNLNAKADNFGPGLLFGPSVTINQTGDNGGVVPIQVVSDNPISENGIQVPDTAPDVASAPTQVAQTADNANDVAAKADGTDGSDDPDDLKKKKKEIGLAQKVGRVTVMLPPKTMSENRTTKDPL